MIREDHTKDLYEYKCTISYLLNKKTPKQQKTPQTHKSRSAHIQTNEAAKKSNIIRFLLFGIN